MIVYVVAGGFDYEGESIESVQLFSRREDAQAYYEQLQRQSVQGEESGYDYAVIEERTVR